MTEPTSPPTALPGPSSTRVRPETPPGAGGPRRARIPKEKWPKPREIRIESQEEAEFFDLLSEMNWVMKVCPVKAMGRVERGELKDVELDQAYARLNDALHGIRHALQAIFHLAGFQDYRCRGEAGPPGEPQAIDAPSASQPRPEWAPKPAPEI